MAAVKQNGWELQFASDEMKADNVANCVPNMDANRNQGPLESGFALLSCYSFLFAFNKLYCFL